MNVFVDYLLTAIPLGMTFLYGCVGEILTEKAGHLNLGIPGIMCVGGDNLRRRRYKICDVGTCGKRRYGLSLCP